MKRRLFIAINLDPHVRRAIGKIEKDIEDGFGRERGDRTRFTPEENWHITVSFLGTQDDASLTAIVGAMRAAAAGFSAPDIAFTEIAYAPPQKKADTGQKNARAISGASSYPRMIWLETAPATSRALGEIRSSLEHLLDAAGIRFEQESRAFAGHITLARLPGGVLRGDLPPIERTVAIHCVGASLDLMESELNPRGARYTVLQEIPFSKVG